jgi:hypothetical protein
MPLTRKELLERDASRDIWQETLDAIRDLNAGKVGAPVLKYALPQVVQDLRDKARARQQKQLWRESGFVGGFEGPEDLSTNYKQYLAEYLDRKYPQHASEK